MEKLLLLATATVGIAGGVLLFDGTGSVDASTPTGKFTRACEKNHKDAADHLMTVYQEERGENFGVRDMGVMVLHKIGIGGLIGSVCACAQESLGEQWSATDDRWVVAGKMAGLREKLNYSQSVKDQEVRERAQAAMRSEVRAVMADNGLSLNQLDAMVRTLDGALDDCRTGRSNRGRP